MNLHLTDPPVSITAVLEKRAAGEKPSYLIDGRRLPRGQKAPLPLPPLERLRAAFTCDPEQGTLTWNYDAAKPNKWNGRYAGKLAGHQTKTGYNTTMLDGAKHRTHRIIWKMCSGEDSRFLIDHINGDQTDNRFSNLREATVSQNGLNRIEDIDSTRGVYLHKKSGRYHVRLHLDEGCLSLGYYTTLEEAREVYKRAAMKYHGAFLRNVGVEMQAAYQRIDELEAALDNCREYFLDRSDVIDGDHGTPRPNKEMRILQDIDGVL